MIFSFLPFAAAGFSLLLAIGSLLPKRRSPARWFFFGGMVVLSVDGLVTGLALRASGLDEAIGGLTLGWIVKSFLPAAWLAFSLTYCRGDWRESVAGWKILLTVFALLPIGLSLGFQHQLLEAVPPETGEEGLQLRFTAFAKALDVLLLVALAWILMNLEQTFRSAVGTTRWRIKFAVLGLAVIFGGHLYVRAQVLLFSTYDVHWSGIESSALLIGCLLLVVAHLRAGFSAIDVYPSRAVLRSSLTLLVAGGYLFVVGVLSKIVRRLGGAESFQLEAFVILLGMAGLAVLLLSDRLRQRIHSFVHRHFARAQHDSVRVWTEFSRRLATVKDRAALCGVSVKLVSETFEVLSVAVWLLDEQEGRLVLGASTAPQSGRATDGCPPAAASTAVAAGLHGKSSPFNLEVVREPWAEEFRELNPAVFPNGGDRWCVPLRAGERSLGALVLADRVNGAGYTGEQLQLLQCIAGQVTSVLLNLRLADEVARARELEAFRTMSAFFVHDLKNTAASLNLMLKNLPVHFDDPAFRQDALRGIGHTARQIDELIGRLTALRQRPEFKPVEADLNGIVSEVLDGLDGMPDVELARELHPLPRMLVDRAQIRSVIANLVLNARDAVGPGGRICVRTENLGGMAALSVTDNGCGMSEEFLRDRLFRPFQSTKKKGLGIGMFQSRMIVEAHGGSIRAESETGKGSAFRVSLPLKDPA